MDLLPVDATLRAAAAANDLAAALALPLADGWDVFPGSLAAGAEPPWGSYLFVQEGAVVGYGGFKGAPAGGEVELGYAIAPGWRGRGLATEAAAALLARAFAEPEVNAVVAHTLAEPGPSTRVLERLGFTRAAELVDPDDGPIWRYRRARHGAEGFLGTWAFDPARARYAAGQPPRDGTYVLAPIPDGVAFTVDWTDPEGNARKVVFSTVFGERDGLSMTRLDASRLETRAAGGPVTVATRILSDDGREMVVEQSGIQGDGSPFCNVSVYVRRAFGPRAP